MTDYAFTPDYSDIEHVMGEIEGEFGLTDDELQELGDQALVMVLSRTRRGIDYEGNPFAPYSESYAKRREKKGRQVDRVDLLFNGHMLANLTATPDQGAARLYFPDANERRIANYHNSLEPRSKIPLRRFLDIEENGDEAMELANMAAEFMAMRINDL